ncbi:MAG TPA: histidine kinase [Bacteroidales bacterium]|nr:histidine kinase [Bacteroidales bacterium]
MRQIKDMEDEKLKRIFRAIHIVVWVFIALLPLVFFTKASKFSAENIILWVKGLFFSIALFYIYYGYVIRTFLRSDSLMKFFLVAFLIFACFIGVEVSADSLVEKMMNPEKDYNLPARIFGNIFIDGFIVSMALLVVLIENWFFTQKHQQDTERKRLESELRMLKFQVNPHFLFNTLNNIYSLVYKKSDRAPEAILKLSSLMRYMLYETDGNQVPLSRELEYLENFVELQRLRLVSNQQVIMNIDGDADGYEIAPLLLVPFIENAFKHGTRASKDTVINISILINAGVLKFSCVNDFDPGISSQVNSGIGMTNVKKRLELMYDGRYNLNIDMNDNKYKVTLTLSL